MSYAHKGSGSGSYSYHSSYNCGDDHSPISPIPVVSSKKTDSLVVLNVHTIDSTSASGCTILAGITGVDIKHTSIVAFGVEYEFSQVGVETKVRRRHSKPVSLEEIRLGYTSLSVEELNEHVMYLRNTKYKCSTYNARSLNCHNFCNELSIFLTDTQIPDRFLKMGDEVASQTTKVAVVGAGAVAAAGLLAYGLNNRQRERQAEANNNGLLMGIGALAAGGLAYHLLSPKEENPQSQAMQKESGIGIGGAGILGALAAGAVGLASALNDEPARQPQRQAGGLRWPGIEDNNAGEDGPAEWIQRMLNLG